MAEAPTLRDLKARERAALDRARAAQRAEFDRVSKRRASSARINRLRWRNMDPATYEAALAARRASGR